MAAIDVDAVFPKRRAQPLGMFAKISREQLLRLKILETDVLTVRQRMVLVDDELEAFGEQRPSIEPVPFFADLSGNAEFGLAVLEIFPDFPAVAAQEAKLQAIEQPLDLIEIGDQQCQIDGMGQRDPECPDFAALERRGKLAGAGGGFVALLEQRMHAQTEFGQLRGGPLATEQI